MGNVKRHRQRTLSGSCLSDVDRIVGDSTVNGHVDALNCVLEQRHISRFNVPKIEINFSTDLVSR